MSYRSICVPSLRFKEILKERGTRGKLYVVWSCLKHGFVAQSIPPLVAMLGKEGVKLNTSSFYRILRREQRRNYTKGFTVRVLASIDELNDFLSQFEMLIVLSKNLFGWVIDESSLEHNFAEKKNNGGKSP